MKMKLCFWAHWLQRSLGPKLVVWTLKDTDDHETTWVGIEPKTTATIEERHVYTLTPGHLCWQGVSKVQSLCAGRNSGNSFYVYCHALKYWSSNWKWPLSSTGPWRFEDINTDPSWPRGVETRPWWLWVRFLQWPDWFLSRHYFNSVPFNSVLYKQQ